MTKKTSKFPRLLPILTVALLLVSLGAAFGVLAGKGPLVGMVSTCVLVLFTALVGGTKFGVSSPTGPMTAAVAVVMIGSKGSADALTLTLLCAAALIFIFRTLQIHKLVEWIPNLVIAGFVNGIAVLILLSQANSIHGLNNWILLLVTFAFCELAHRFKNKIQSELVEVITSSFIVIVIMSLAVKLLGVEVDTIDLQGLNIADALAVHFPEVNFSAVWAVLPLAFELSLIAILDTLLTGLIMEKESKVKTDFKRELSGQSLAMFVIALIGGIPGAQSTVPSMLFFKEGASHKFAKVILAIMTIIVCLLLTPLLEWIPEAVFAGVIFKIAFDVADLTSIRKARPVQFIMIIGTLLSTVLISLNMAVIGFTLVFIAWNHFAPKRLQVPDLKFKEETEGLIDEL